MNQDNFKKGAKLVLKDCLNLKENEKLLIVADLDNKKIAYELAEYGEKVGADVAISLFYKKSSHGEDPPQPIISAMSEADVIVMATVFSLSSSNARRKANEKGARIISIPGCNEELFQSKSAFVDFKKQKKMIDKVGELMTNGKKIKITSELGTSLEAELCGRQSVNQDAIVHEPGTWSPFPNIEVAVGPKMDSINGIFVVDGVIIPTGYVDEPVFVEIIKGKITNIKGGETARKFEDLLASYDDPNIYSIVEIGIGFNPKSEFGKGSMGEDESKFGTLHLGVGEGRTFGVPNIAPAHLDMVIRNPEIEIDDKIIFKNENILI